MAQEIIDLIVNPASALNALKEINDGLSRTEGKFDQNNQHLQDQVKKLSDFLVTSGDRQIKSIDAHVRALERQAAAYGKTPIERTIALRDKEIASIQKSGIALEKQAEIIKRVTAAYDQMIAAQMKAANGGGEGNNFGKEFAENAKKFIESPLSSIGDLAKGLVGELGPVGTAIIGVASTFSAFAAAGYEAAKSLAEYGLHVRDVQIRTGLTSKEVGQFSYAAKAAGADVEIFERLMRGLTLALEDTSAKSETARATLRGFGVDIQAVKDGTASTSDVLLKIGEGLNKLPDVWSRNKAAIDLFKRAGIEATPVLLELVENVRRAKELGFGPSQESIDQWVGYKRTLTEAEAKVAGVKRALTDLVAKPFIAILRIALQAGDGRPLDIDELVKSGNLKSNPYARNDPNERAAGRAAGFRVPITSQSNNFSAATAAEALLQETRRRAAQAGIGQDQTAFGQTKEGLTSLYSSAEATEKADRERYFGLKDDKTTNPEAIREARDQWLEAAKAAEKYKAALDGIKEGIKGDHKLDELAAEYDKKQARQLDGEQKINAEYDAREAHIQKLLTLTNSQTEKAKAILELERKSDLEKYHRDLNRANLDAQFSSDNSVAQANIRNSSSLASARRRAAGIEVDETDVNADYQKEKALADLEHAASIKHVEDLAREGDQKKTNEAAFKATEEYRKAIQEAELHRQLALIGLDAMRVKEAEKLGKAQLDNALKLQDTEDRIQQKRETSTLNYQVKLRNELGHTTPGADNQNAIAGQNASDRIAVAELENQQAQERLNREAAAIQQQLAGVDQRVARENEMERIRRESLNAEATKQEQIDEAHRTYTLDTIAIWNKQYDEIKSKVEGLLHTAFTNPKNFPKQLETTLRDAALKPVEQSLASGLSYGINTILHGGRPEDHTKLSNIEGIGKKDDALKVWVTNNPAPVQYPGQPQRQASASPTGTWKANDVNYEGGNMVVTPSLPSSPSWSTSVGGNPTAGFLALVARAREQAAQRPAERPQDYQIEYTMKGDDGSTYALGANTHRWEPDSDGATAPQSGAAGGQGANDADSLVNGLWPTRTNNAGDIIANQIFKDTNKSGGPLSGFKNSLTNLGGAINYKGDGQWNTSKWTGGESEGQGLSGAAEGIATSPIVGAAGLSLAERGLLGKDRGTTAGIFEGAIGGAAVGAQYGGPLGAAIGAGVGAGIGLGEKLAGVETPENEAKRLVKQIYHINIDTAMVNQIVSVANSKYGKQIALAVKDPDIRKALQLYATGTGQGGKFPVSASSPHSGSLVEQGGKLQQQETYQYGVGYAFNSSLPVAGGGNPTLLPSPGQPAGSQPMMLSINVAGKGAGDFLAGSVVTSDYVNAQWQSAQNSSNGRIDNSAMIQSAGLITS